MKQQDNTIRLTENTPLAEFLDIILDRLTPAAEARDAKDAIFSLIVSTSEHINTVTPCISSADGQTLVEKSFSYSKFCPRALTRDAILRNINDILNERSEKQDGKEAS